MPGTAGELPLADVGGAQLRTGQPNPVTGRSDMTVLELANDTVAFAVALKGDAYPRVMLQPTKGLLAGDGTAQPSATMAAKGVLADKIIWVTKEGSDANDGLSFGTAKLTVAAAVTALGVNPGTIMLGGGTFTETVAIPIPVGGCVKFVGAGSQQTVIQNATTDVVAMPATGRRIIFEDLTLHSQAGGGHVFAGTGCQIGFFTLNRCALNQDNAAKSIYDMQGGGGELIDCWVVDCDQTVGNNTVPAWNLIMSGAGAAIAKNTWQRGRVTTGAAGTYFFHVECAVNGVYALDNALRDLNFEVPNGGCARFLSTQGTVWDNLTAFDITTTTADLFVLGKSASSTSLSQNSLVTNVNRRGGALGGGFVDIRLRAGEQGTSTFIECAGAVIDNAGNNANKYIECSNPTNLGTSVVMTGDPWNIVANFDDLRYGSTITMETNRAYYTRVKTGGTISKLRMYCTTSSGHISVAVYRNAGSGLAAAPTGGQVATSGSVVCPGAGQTSDVSLGASVDVYPGDWLAISCDNAVAQFQGVEAGNFGSTVAAGRSGIQDAAHPLPANPVIGYGLCSPVLLVGVP